MHWLTRSLIIFTGVAVIFGAGFVLGERMATRHLEFAGMRVNHALDYRRLVQHYSPEMKALARTFGSLEEAYLYVRDDIRYEPWRSVQGPADTVRTGAASCMGKAVLLCSLFRAMGVGPESTFVVTGRVASGEAAVDHAWVSLVREGTHYQLDPSSLLGRFAFDDFTGGEYTRSFMRSEQFCFNDRGFAVVSRLNAMRR